MIAAMISAAAIAAVADPVPPVSPPSTVTTVTAPAKVALKTSRFDDVICEKVEATGTRLGAKQVCMKRAHWDDLADANRQWLNRQQDYRTPPSDGGSSKPIASNAFGTPDTGPN